MSVNARLIHVIPCWPSLARLGQARTGYEILGQFNADYFRL